MKKFLTQFTKVLRIAFIAMITASLATIFYQFSLQLSGVSSYKSNLNIATNYAYWIDESNLITDKQILEYFDNFKTTKENGIPFALKNQTYWINVTFNNLAAESKNLVLYIDNKLLDTLEVYKVKQNTLTAHQANYESTLNKVYPHINIEIDSDTTQQYLLKIQTDGPPNVPLKVLSEAAFSQHMMFAQFLFGAFIGVTLLMAIYNMVLFFAVNDKVYLMYIGYLIVAFLVMSSIAGFGHLIFANHINTLIDSYLVVLHFFLVIFLLLFTTFFLRYDQQKGKLYKLAITTSSVMFILAIATLSLDQIQQAKVFFSIQPFILFLALFLLFRQIKNNLSWAKYYLASWVPLLIGASIQPAVLLNLLDYSFLTSNAFLIAIILEVTLMAFALAERMKRNEQDTLTNIAYHISSKIPRKSNLENCVNNLSQNTNTSFSVGIIKPEHIDKVALYVNDEINTSLFQQLNKKLSNLFKYNDAVVPLTDKNEKLCLINNACFAFVIDNDVNEQPIETFVQSIQQIVLENFYLEKLKLPLSAIVGFANFPEHGEKSHQLINRALIATANAEQSSEKWAIFTRESNDSTNFLFKLTRDLKQAINDNTLALYHQPQIDLRTLRVCSSECLLRWNHPTEGFISPTVFIPIAEDMGLINELTFWVIKQALQQQNYLTQECGYNHLISINISGKDICSNKFLVKTLEIIEASGVPTDKIIFELTESASFRDNKQAIHVVEQLTELGITISIDDFGTGYSSMSQINHLPFQELKVDREFVENINQDKKRLVIAEATVKMAKGLGLEVVAEGINSEEDEYTLRQFGCDIGQGFYYAKPMPLEEYAQWLDSLIQGRVKQPIQGEFIPADK